MYKVGMTTTVVSNIVMESIYELKIDANDMAFIGELITFHNVRNVMTHRYYKLVHVCIAHVILNCEKKCPQVRYHQMGCEFILLQKIYNLPIVMKTVLTERSQYIY